MKPLVYWELTFETKVRNQFRYDIFLKKSKVSKIDFYKRTKDNSLSILIKKFEDLELYTQEILFWLEEFRVVQCILLDGYEKFKQDSDLIYFYTNYFYTFINNVYVFNVRVTKLLRTHESIDPQLIRKIQQSGKYNFLMTRFRMDYVHNWKSIFFSKSLKTGEQAVCYKSGRNVEFYQLDYLFDSCATTFILIRNIILLW